MLDYAICFSNPLSSMADTMDQGHYNCRDYYITPHFSATTIVNDPASWSRHESFDELETRSRSPDADKPKFPLLKLPLELRQQILSLILPHTQEFKDSGRLSEHVRNFSAVKKRAAKGMHVPAATKSATGQNAVSNVVWQRGNIKIFSVCRQLHQECSELVYGCNIFLLFVTYKEIQWRFRWLIPSGFAPSRSYPFLELLPQRYMRLIKRVVVHVDHVDNYMGIIKFNVGGKGLIHGLKRQVHRLVLALGAGEPSQTGDLQNSDARLAQINIMLNSQRSVQQDDCDEPLEDLEDILHPFSYLRGVRNVTVGGAVRPEYAANLKTVMKSTEPCDATVVSKVPDEGMSVSNRVGGVQLCVYGNDI